MKNMNYYQLHKYILSFGLLFAASSPLQAQLDSIKIKPLLKAHISTLASDEYGGREPGTKGEKLSSIYIIKQFTEIGLVAKGEKGFLQPFTFTKSLKTGPKSKLKVRETEFETGHASYPLAYSANASAKGKAV